MATFNYNLYTSAFEPAPGWDVNSRIGGWAIGVGPVAFSDSARAGTDRPRAGFVDAGATAGVNANVGNWGGATWGASMTSYGSAHANIFPDQAFAFSNINTKIYAGWSWRNGHIVWSPIISDSVGGSAFAAGTRWRPIRNRDPISFSGLDLGGNELWTDSFFDIFLELSAPMDWDATSFRTTDPTGPLDLSFSIAMDDPFITSGKGTMNLQIVNGQVTQSQTTGVFGTLGLPSVGTVVGNSLTLPLGNQFTIDYDLTPRGASDLLVTLGGGGSALLPEPTSVCAALVGVSVLVLRRRA
ncbi:MAG: hypothetical protein QM770_17060 [Tepidisphaeraceae bacterium]